MRSTIDKAGRIVVPKALREAARLEPGTVVDVRLRGGVIEIEPAPRDVKLVRRGRFTVAIPHEPGPPLTSETVQRTRDDVSEGRA